MVNIRDLELEWNINELKSCIDILEDSLQKNVSEFNKTSEEELKKYANHPDFGFFEVDMIDQYWRLTERFPRILRNSLLTTCYSFLEYKLIEICKDEKKRKSLQLDVNDLSGKGIERSKNYLKKVANIDFPEDASWNEIKHINRIRNVIVHKDGILDSLEESKKIREYIKGRSDISIDDYNSIYLGENYCRNVVDIIETFLKELYRYMQ